MLTTGTRCAKHFHSNIGFIDLDIGLFKNGPHLHTGKTRLASSLIVERTDSHQSMRAALGRKQSVCVSATHSEVGRENACFSAK
jgi:hypothetical protein